MWQKNSFLVANYIVPGADVIVGWDCVLTTKAIANNAARMDGAAAVAVNVVIVNSNNTETRE